MKTVIGIDLGTQHLKIVFYDFNARQVVAVESAPLDLYQGDAGVAEQQSQWWLNALRDAATRKRKSSWLLDFCAATQVARI